MQTDLSVFGSDVASQNSAQWSQDIKTWRNKMTLAEKARNGRRIALEAMAEARANKKHALQVMKFRSVRPLVLRHRVENIFNFNEIASERRQMMPLQIAS